MSEKFSPAPPIDECFVPQAAYPKREAVTFAAAVVMVGAALGRFIHKQLTEQNNA